MLSDAVDVSMFRNLFGFSLIGSCLALLRRMYRYTPMIRTMREPTPAATPMISAFFDGGPPSPPPFPSPFPLVVPFELWLPCTLDAAEPAWSTPVPV